MKYISTRGGSKPRAFSDILLEGLAPDGGLFVPEEYPNFSAADLARLRPMSYADLAFEILSRFADDVPPAELRRMVADAYSEQVFRSADVTPLKTLAPGLHLLGLSNGPTLAFKDLAMQFLGRLFEYVLAKKGDSLNILGATSGDTGSSAEYAMRGRKGVRVFMLSPFGRMSPFQTAQMFSLDDANIFNIAVRGVFDDCQDVVKAVSNDLDFKARHRIGAVNSINWARIAAQVVYYFKGYFAATKKDREPVQFAVPTGNFGNILAGHIAREMGLPVARLILATNENDVLREFFATGVYRVRKTADVKATSSPSMDISKASNFERYVHDLLGRDSARLATLWRRVDQEGVLDLSGDDAFKRVRETGFVAGSSSHEDRIATMAKVWRDYGVMIDTHTADGVKVGLEQRLPNVPLVCLETALPVKFADSVREALGREPERPAGYEKLEDLPQRFELMDADPAAVKRFIERQARD
jgi:threonine synthase